MKYPYLLFDADDTLFDFQKGAVRAFEIMCHTCEIPYTPETYRLYHEINKVLWAAFDRGEYESAIAYYVKALAINPDYEPALFKQALSYKEMGDIQSANNLFGEVILRFPDTELARRAQQERGY